LVGGAGFEPATPTILTTKRIPRKPKQIPTKTRKNDGFREQNFYRHVRPVSAIFNPLLTPELHRTLKGNARRVRPVSPELIG